MSQILCLFLLVATIGIHAGEINLYSFNTGSFVYHLTGNYGQYSEFFDNKFMSVERKFSEDSKYSALLGTMDNSFGDRCIAMGLRRDWASGDSGWVFKGIYGYTGEFFFNAFKYCGDHGSYNDFKKVTGIGFSPYIYHAIQYNFTDYFGVESGIIIPSVFVISVQWSFR
ncbi:hypothetical protein GE278_23230 (plasmid) [Enterobacteriaceae bacterium Kacie_13]|nr:hypothetical protein GE278_23230 [Enterobacteriaceae bacterium Kacie_13]